MRVTVSKPCNVNDRGISERAVAVLQCRSADLNSVCVSILNRRRADIQQQVLVPERLEFFNGFMQRFQRIGMDAEKHFRFRCERAHIGVVLGRCTV